MTQLVSIEVTVDIETSKGAESFTFVLAENDDEETVKAFAERVRKDIRTMADAMLT